MDEVRSHVSPLRSGCALLTRRLLCQTVGVTAVCSVCFLVRAALVVVLALCAFKGRETYDDVRTVGPCVRALREFT